MFTIRKTCKASRQQFVNISFQTFVPLADIMLHHDFVPEWKGSSRCHLEANYYNTRVSAWEPFLESWRCVLVSPIHYYSSYYYYCFFT